MFYDSRKLNEHEKNYPTHDIELVAIIHSLYMWRNNIISRMFVLMRDHSGLRNLFDQSNLNSKKARWLAMISGFNFDIWYIKRKENKVIDALSNRVHVNHIKTMSSYGTYLQIISYK